MGVSVADGEICSQPGGKGGVSLTDTSRFAPDPTIRYPLAHIRLLARRPVLLLLPAGLAMAARDNLFMPGSINQHVERNAISRSPPR